MKVEDVVSGIKDGSITVLKNNHITNPILRDIEDRMKYYKHIRFGDSICDVEIYCFNCDLRLNLFLLDEKTVGFYHGDKYDFYSKKTNNNISIHDIKQCNGSHFLEQRKLVSKIHCPTGNIVFKNYFNAEHLHTDPSNKWGYPGINSLVGRNMLMQYLATQNVGYGQMGNMGVSIYSNSKDEIIVTENTSSLEEQMYDDPDYTEEEIEYAYRNHKNADKRKKLICDFKQYLEERNLKYIGSLSLQVWRWVCADQKVLEDNGEIIDSNIIANVDKGDWVIEHYFEIFMDREIIIYSKLKLK